MDHGKGLKNRGTLASEASGPQKLEKLYLGGNLKFFGYGCVLLCLTLSIGKHHDGAPRKCVLHLNWLSSLGNLQTQK